MMMTDVDTCPNCGFYYELGRKDERKAMNNAQRAAMAPAGTRWYGLWNGSGWLRTIDEVWFWGPKSVMMAMAEDFNSRKKMSWEDPNSRVIAKAFPDPDLDEAEAHQQEPEPPPPSDTSFKW